MCFLNLNHLQDAKVICGGPNTNQKGNEVALELHFYSLTRCQKAIATTLVVLSLIAVIVGAIYLNTERSVAALSAGAGCLLGFTLGGVVIKYFMFKYKVDRYLGAQPEGVKAAWTHWASYQNEENQNALTNKHDRTTGTDVHVLCYVKNSTSGLESYHVDFSQEE